MSIQQLASPVRTLENGHFTSAQALSLSLHVALIVLLLLPAAVRVTNPPRIDDILKSHALSPIKWLGPGDGHAQRMKRKGSGGDRTPTEPTAGKLPRFDWEQFAPPKPIPPKDARLRMEPTLIGDPQFQLADSNLPNWGDPRRTLITLAGGPGGGDGVGGKCCGGVGDTPGGRGVDEEGRGARPAGVGGYGTPLCTYCPNPAFTDEAVKTRHQGKVLLRALVTADGRVTNISVVRGLGMGLDENAIAKVKAWRLTPARGPDGRPAAVWTLIEFVFRQH